MSLTTLAAVKEALGISGTSEDARLTRLIRNACAIIRAACPQYCFGGVISSASVAAASVVTAIGHGLQTGQTVVISGSNSTPTIDGERVVTRLTDDTFSVPVTVTSAGTAGNYAVKFTEFYAGNGTNKLVLRRLPVQSVSAVYEDEGACYGEASGAFAASTLLVAGTDYCLVRDGGNVAEVSRSGILLRIGDEWPSAGKRILELLASGVQEGIGNVKVTYTAGFQQIPYDLQSAVEQLVAEHRRSADAGGGMQSESLDYYSYQKMSPADQAKSVGSIRAILRRYKPLVF